MLPSKSARAQPGGSKDEKPADDWSAGSALGSGFTQALMPELAGVDVQTDLPVRSGLKK